MEFTPIFRLVEQTCNGTSLDCYDKSDCMKTNQRPIVLSSILRILIQCVAGLTRNRVSPVGFTWSTVAALTGREGEGPRKEEARGVGHLVPLRQLGVTLRKILIESEIR